MSDLVWEIEEYVSNGTNLDQIMPIIKSIPFELLKTLISPGISSITSDSAMKLCYKYRPIHHILPDDITQYMLSFIPNHYNQQKLVSKSWKSLFQKNRAMEDRQRNKAVTDYQHLCKVDIPYDVTTNKTWIVNEENPLTQRLLNSTKSGDKILIHPGVYPIDWYRESVYCQNGQKYTNLQIIGIGEPGEVSLYSARGMFHHGTVRIKNGKISFDNIHFDVDIEYNGNGTIWFSNCIIEHNKFNIMSGSARIYNCDFDNNAEHAISIENDVRNVTIVGNKFDDTEYAGVSYTCGTIDELVCIGNMFINYDSEAINCFHYECEHDEDLDEDEDDPDSDVAVTHMTIPAPPAPPGAEPNAEDATILVDLRTSKQKRIARKSKPINLEIHDNFVRNIATDYKYGDPNIVYSFEM